MQFILITPLSYYPLLHIFNSTQLNNFLVLVLVLLIFSIPVFQSIYFALHIFSLQSVHFFHSLQSQYLFYPTGMLSRSNKQKQLILHKEIKNITQFIFNCLIFPYFCLILLYSTFVSQQTTFLFLFISILFVFFYSISPYIFFIFHLSISLILYTHNIFSILQTCYLDHNAAFFICFVSALQVIRQLIYNQKGEMNRYYLQFIAVLSLCVIISCCYEQPSGCTPYGVRLALGRSFFHQQDNETMSIWFNTRLDCVKSHVTIEKLTLIKKVYCENKKVAFANYSSFVHRCSLDFIRRGQSFEYQAYGWSGSQSEPSIPFSNSNIRARLILGNDSTKMIVLADWSYLVLKKNTYDSLDQAFQTLLKSENQPDLVYMGGDYAYDFSSNNGLNYDNFLIMMSQISSKWPFILTTGNHEYKTPDDFMLFCSTFELYNLTNNNITTIKIGSFDIILLDPYGIIFENETKDGLIDRFRSQLEKTTKGKPVIVGSHYPLACSGSSDHCKQEKTILKQFFDLMIDFNVVLYIGAHYHTYQRLYPYKKDDTFLLTPPPYTLTRDSKYLVSVVEGIAGNDKQIVQSYGKLQNFTAAVYCNQTGFGTVSVGPKQLKYQHFSSKNALKPLDTLTIGFQQLFKKNLKSE